MKAHVFSQFMPLTSRRRAFEAKNFKHVTFCPMLCVEDYHKLTKTKFLIQSPLDEPTLPPPQALVASWESHDLARACGIL